MSDLIKIQGNQRGSCSFKHLGVLRKALSKGHTGEIAYKTLGEEKGCIDVNAGDVISNEDNIQALEKLLTECIANCELVTKRIGKEMKSTPPSVILARVINDIHWSDETVERLKNSFVQLPPITVKMAPIYNYGYDDCLTYLMLFQESLKDENFTTEKFFSIRPEYASIEQKVKVLVLGYCLGLVNPKEPRKAQSKAKTTTGKRRLSMASRILRKIAGL